MRGERGLEGIVGGEEHEAARGMPLDHLPHDPAAMLVEMAAGLVEQQHRRIVQDGEREPQPLLHATRVRRDAIVGTRTEPDLLERGRGGRRRIGEAMRLPAKRRFSRAVNSS
jgi:hypothetical protein